MSETIKPGSMIEELSLIPSKYDGKLKDLEGEEELDFNIVEDTTELAGPIKPLSGTHNAYRESFSSHMSESLVDGEYERDEKYWEELKEQILDAVCQIKNRQTKKEQGVGKIDFQNEELFEMTIYNLKIFKEIEKYYGGEIRPNDPEVYYMGVAPLVKKIVLDDFSIQGQPIKVIVDIAYSKKHHDIFCKNIEIEK